MVTVTYPYVLRGTTEFGTRTETKNVNSLTAIQKVVEYEALRQAKLIEAGGKVDQETRTWDDAQGITLGMRKKRRRKRLPLLPRTRFGTNRNYR